MEDTDQEINEEKLKFTENFSLIFEENGHPRIAGQIIGWLIICEPPEQSFSDLVENLQVSKASVSNMTRLLLQVGFIEKVRKPGERQVYFRLVDDAWRQVMENHLEFVFSLRDLASEYLENADHKEIDRLHEMYEYHKFIAQKMPQVIEDFKKEKN
ncbi:GbsR/MarR family transcriptional regulator [Halalkalibaculum sp. DA3122]|uniref:GbsR/MarR family transcriptional regulator n=1 Tax=unclassified Halalkalibaculum TaxID=2964617 RepID=UPI003755171C